MILDSDPTVLTYLLTCCMYSDTIWVIHCLQYVITVGSSTDFIRDPSIYIVDTDVTDPFSAKHSEEHVIITYI